jgi:hypothetical protein
LLTQPLAPSVPPESSTPASIARQLRRRRTPSGYRSSL